MWEGPTKEAHDQEEVLPSGEQPEEQRVGGGGGVPPTSHTHAHAHTDCVNHLSQRLQSSGWLDAAVTACATCYRGRLGNKGPRAPGRRHCRYINCQAEETTPSGQQRQRDLISRSDGGPGTTAEQ